MLYSNEAVSPLSECSPSYLMTACVCDYPVHLAIQSHDLPPATSNMASNVNMNMKSLTPSLLTGRFSTLCGLPQESAGPHPGVQHIIGEN